MEDRDEERELMRRAAAGDEEAFRVLVDRSSRGVYRVAYRITADRATAEDVVQEAFLRAYRALPGFDGSSGFSTWIHRIARNAAIDSLRRARVRLEVAGGAGPDAAGPCADPDPERRAVSGDLGRAVERALTDLSEMERAAFVLRHYEGCTTAEIAKALGLKSGATRHAVFRAVRKLRDALAPYVRPRACETGAP